MAEDMDSSLKKMTLGAEAAGSDAASVGTDFACTKVHS